MEDETCVRFLRWALPRLRLRWAGFRKVRKQVCKRIQRRIEQLNLHNVDDYQTYLQIDAAEWDTLDTLCRVTISRFYRDKMVLSHLRTEVLPALAQRAGEYEDARLRCWSAGCASGEEAYSLVLIWEMAVARYYPQLDIHVTATDIDGKLLERAARACYSFSSIKALPEAWINTAFIQKGKNYCLEEHFRNKVTFGMQDIRQNVPSGMFYVVFCRNMAFTYFARALQYKVLENIRKTLIDGGALVIGGHESLPEGETGFQQWAGCRAIYRKCGGSSTTLSSVAQG